MPWRWSFFASWNSLSEALNALTVGAGRTEEAGSHEELIASGGLYSRLVGQQMAAAVGRCG